MAAAASNGRASTLNGHSYGQSISKTPMPNSPASHLSSTSASNAAAAAATPLMRRAYLDESALSPQEYAVYTASFASIKPAASGQPGLVDEADGIRYLRDECALNMEDELDILSLFERTPRGLGSGHFYAMLRLVSWTQQGRPATKELLFTQTSPVRITHQREKADVSPQRTRAATTSIASPQSVQSSPVPRSQTSQAAVAPKQSHPTAAAASAAPTSKPPQPPPPPKPETKPMLTPVREEAPSTSPAGPSPLPPSGGAAAAPAIAMASVPPAVPAKPSFPVLVAPKPKHAAPHIHFESIGKHKQPAPPVPSASANPFRDGAAATAPMLQTLSASMAPTTSNATPSQALLGFDPAPNPFKQSKPRIVKPTPVRASSPASNPFRNGTPAMAHPSSFPPRVVLDAADDGGSSQASSSRSRRLERLLGSPPLPPRPMLDRNPPPLPPRHISPLIQAGLHASSEVRRAKQALPPKTFTVLQSSSSKHPVSEKPRLLNGQTAPPEVLPPPQHLKRRSVSGNKVFAPSSLAHGGETIGASSTAGGDWRKATSDAHSYQHRGSGSTSEIAGANEGRRGPGSQARLNEDDDAGKAEAGSSVSRRMPPTVAPKPSYPYNKADLDSQTTSRTKSTLPSWLKEQEALQREALESGAEPPAPPPIQPTEGAVRSRNVVDDLDDEAEAMSDEARRATGLDRGNPFLPPRFRNHEPGTLAGPEDSLDIDSTGGENDERDAVPSSAAEPGRPLGRSKTLGAKAAGGALPPPRRRLDSFPQQGQQWGHALDSGTYAGFKPNKETANSGGLRLVPPSKQAKMHGSAAELAQEGIRPAEDLRGGSHPHSHSQRHYQDDSHPQRGGARSTTSSQHSSSGQDAVSPSTPNTAGLPSRQPMRRQGSNTNSVGSGLRERVSEMLRLNDGPPKGQRPVDLLGQDIQALVQKHDWLARAAAGATGKPLGGERARLMQDFDGDGTTQDDAPAAAAGTAAETDGPWLPGLGGGLRRAGSLNPKRSASYGATAGSGGAGPTRRSMETTRAPPVAPSLGAASSRRWSSYVASKPQHASQHAQAERQCADVRESAVDDEEEEADELHKFAGSGDSGLLKEESRREGEGWERL